MIHRVPAKTLQHCSCNFTISVKDSAILLESFQERKKNKRCKGNATKFEEMQKEV